MWTAENKVTMFDLLRSKTSTVLGFAACIGATVSLSACSRANAENPQKVAGVTCEGDKIVGASGGDFFTEGDTLSKYAKEISRRDDVNFKAVERIILNMNPNVTPTQIMPGDVIHLPKSCK